MSRSGEHHCLREETPCKVVAVDEYIGTYLPLAREGQRFVGWENCPDQQGENCALNLDADTVYKNGGKTMPPLIAEFAPACADAPADSFAAIKTLILNGKGRNKGGYHSGNGAQAGMNLSIGAPCTNKVNLLTQTGSGLMRILP